MVCPEFPLEMLECGCCRHLWSAAQAVIVVGEVAFVFCIQEQQWQVADLLICCSHSCCWAFRSDYAAAGWSAFNMHVPTSQILWGEVLQCPSRVTGLQYWQWGTQSSWLCREGLQMTMLPFGCRVQPCGGRGSCGGERGRLPQALCGETCQR